MIKLEKNNSTLDNWKNWEVIVGGKRFSLENHGSLWDDNTCYFPSGGEYSLSITDVMDCELTDFPTELYLNIDNKDGVLGRNITTLYLCTNSAPDSSYFGFCWDIKIEEWKGHFNPFMIRDEIANILKSQTEFPVNENMSLDDDSGFASIYFDLNINDIKSFKEFCNRFPLFMDKAFDEVEERLSIGGFSNKVVAKFSFDEQTQQTCISYLNYFIDFLRDLGIHAKAEVDNSGEDVLFSIKPNSKNESLVNISQALSFYLKLPQANLNAIVDEHSDPIVELRMERLKSEIERLKGNLRTSEALIRYQDKLLTNGAQHTINNIREPIDAIQTIHVDGEKKDKNEFLGGGIKLGVFKKAGIEFDWNALLGHFKSK